MAKFIRVIGWSKYQHYKERDPKWVKLYRSMLTSDSWVDADDASRVLAVACILLAAETGNQIPLNLKHIRRRAYLNSEPNFDFLISCGFIEIVDCEQNASNPLADRYQNACLEGEGEKSREELEGEESAPPSTPKYVVPTNGEPPEGLNEREYALWFWEELQVPATRTTLPVAADAIRLIAKHESCSLYDAAKRMLSRAVEYQHDTHKPINQFWFTDGGHKASAAATKQPMQWVEREQ